MDASPKSRQDAAELVIMWIYKSLTGEPCFPRCIGRLDRSLVLVVHRLLFPLADVHWAFFFDDDDDDDDNDLGLWALHMNSSDWESPWRHRVDPRRILVENRVLVDISEQIEVMDSSSIN
jgi:hypothetical protein